MTTTLTLLLLLHCCCCYCSVQNCREAPGSRAHSCCGCHGARKKIHVFWLCPQMLHSMLSFDADLLAGGLLLFHVLQHRSTSQTFTLLVPSAYLLPTIDLSLLAPSCCSGFFRRICGATTGTRQCQSGPPASACPLHRWVWQNKLRSNLSQAAMASRWDGACQWDRVRLRA